MFDLIIRNGTLVTAKAAIQADLGVVDEKIALISEEISEESAQEIDATGLHVFPGLIDTHVHFNEPGRADWEGVTTGSSALAAGGGTLYCDMPLNSDPPLLTKEDFHAKKVVSEQKAVTDFAFWGGLTPDNLEHLEDLKECGVMGFKAFMSNSGIAEFKAADDLTLYRGMTKAAQLGLPVAVHAESENITRQLTGELRDQGRIDIDAYLESRPILAELEAISRAMLYAKETGCELHIVHVSNARGMALIADAVMLGTNVSSETCAHYLHFSEDTLKQKGATAKCAPPLRNNNERQALWQSVLRGEVSMIASDHSPSDPELKNSSDFFNVWGGVAGVQSTLNVLLSHREEQGLPLSKIAQLTAGNPAVRFGFYEKGNLALGFDADFSLVDLTQSFKLEPNDLHYRHKISPYVGEQLKGSIQQTFVRGRCIFKEGAAQGVQGKLIKPD